MLDIRSLFFYLLSADYFVGIDHSTYLFYDVFKISVSNTALTRCINSYVVAILLEQFQSTIKILVLETFKHKFILK